MDETAVASEGANGHLTGQHYCDDVRRLRFSLAGDGRVWREVEVASDMPLLDLHYVIQATMGWTNSHLHQFITKAGQCYFDDRCESRLAEGRLGDFDEAGVRVGDLLVAPGHVLTYNYDYGDDWRVVVKQVSRGQSRLRAELPTFLGGECSGPPEDCGGVDGYLDILAGFEGRWREVRPSAGLTWTRMKRWLGGWKPAFVNDQTRLSRYYRSIKAESEANTAGATEAEWRGLYERKFAEFVRMCGTRPERVVVAHPSVLGDDYPEIVESLNRIASAGAELAIAGPGPAVRAHFQRP